jgi:hypothetical protein
VKIFPDKQLNIKETWLASFRLYSKAFSRVWPQAAILSAIMVVMAWMNAHVMAPLIKKMQSATFKFSDMIPTDVIYIFASLTLLTFVIYFSGVLLHRIYLIGKEQKITLYDSLAFIGKKYFIVVSGALLVSCICLLGTVALLFPGIFLFVLLIMVQPLILFDDKGCFAALKSSCKLVWGNWWHTFAILCPLIICNYAAGFCTQIVSSHGYWWCGTLVSALIVTFLYPLFYACVLIQFDDLKLRRRRAIK